MIISLQDSLAMVTMHSNKGPMFSKKEKTCLKVAIAKRWELLKR